ncbi:hypothetical protein EW093_10990 [Thiospirochaeta perfilievii]|uniref:Uncharacterized protein n=1 Tax=Thiospirochaeta perfilievii TaxID=252967 RepID=A0A5C1QEU7_9SPIO|nr:hypothetical protein [Thiospirochaeta perfilievii]QEN05214.1 hypothetical protein EW093_10990 [Thiospirochaeta perfilievii]
MLVLAGDYPYIYALGEAESVLVEAAQITTVDVEINTYQITTNWPTDDILTGTTFTVTHEITLPISVIDFNTGSTLYSKYYLDNNTYYSIDFSRSENTFTASTVIDSPITSGEYTLHIMNTSSMLKLNDDDYDISSTLSSFCNSYWELDLNISTINEAYYTMQPYFQGEINVIDDPNRGLSVTIGWGED